MFSIEEFKANFLGGARPNKFEVEVPNLPDKVRYLIKAAPIPPGTIGEIIFHYQGTQTKLAGDRSYPDWNCSLVLDEDYAGYNEILAWQAIVKEHDTGLGANNHNLYKKDCFITHYSQAGEVIGQFQMFGAWPKEVGEIPLSWDTVDSPIEVSLIFSFDYWKRIA